MIDPDHPARCRAARRARRSGDRDHRPACDAAHAHPSRPRRRHRHAHPGESALRVYVHERGATHLADPDRLMASATRLYGDEMDQLWGDFQPVPQEALVVARRRRANRGRRPGAHVAYTPGPRVAPRQLLQRRFRHRLRRRHRWDQLTAGWRSSAADAAAGHRSRDLGATACAASPRGVRALFFVTHFGPTRQSARTLTESVEPRADREPRPGVLLVGKRRGSRAWFAEQLRRDLRRRMGETDAQAYRGGGTVRSELARAGKILEEKEAI